MPLVFGFARAIFRISAVVVRERFRNERWARDSARVRWTIIKIVNRSCALSFRDLDFFFSFFFFDLRLVSLEPRFKFQRALRPKEEDRRGLDKLSRRGAATNGFSFFGSVFWIQSMGSHCYYFVIVLVLVYVVIVVLSGRLHAGPSSRSSHHGHRDFLLVLRKKDLRFELVLR